MTTRKMLYSGHSILGTLSTSPAWKVSLGASAIACIILLLPAWVLNLHSIPTANDNLGFFYTIHWSLVYSIVIPTLLAMAVAVSERMKDCVIQLIDGGRITAINATGTPSYSEALSKFLQSWAKELVIGAVAISIVVTIYDTHDLWLGFFRNGVVPETRNPGWDTAFNAYNWVNGYKLADFPAYQQPSWVSNLIFDLIAYLFQGAALFLGLFWTGKFTLFVTAFARLIGGTDSDYQFNPLTHDLDYRMGLKPMGKLFDNFLSFTLAIVSFAFFKRLYSIDSGRGDYFGTYISDIFGRVISPENQLRAPFNSISELLNARSLGFDKADFDTSSLVTILFMTIPIFVICLLPLWKIRSLVDKRRNEELGLLQKEYEKARKLQKFDKIQLIEYEKQCLEKASIWPNGNLRARRYLTFIVALAAGAVSPPFFIIVLAVNMSEGIGKYFKLIFQKKATD